MFAFKKKKTDVKSLVVELSDVYNTLRSGYVITKSFAESDKEETAEFINHTTEIFADAFEEFYEVLSRAAEGSGVSLCRRMHDIQFDGSKGNMKYQKINVR